MSILGDDRTLAASVQKKTHSKVHVSKYLPSGTRFVAAGNVADFIGSMSAALRRGGEHSYLGIFGVYIYIYYKYIW